MDMSMSCPKCGRRLEEGELTVGDGCSCCCYPPKDSASKTAKDMKLSGSFSERAISIVIYIVLMIGMVALVLWGFLWLLSGGTIFS